MAIGSTMAMPGYVGPLGNNCSRNSQSGGIVILIPLTYTSHNGHHKNSDHQHKDDGEHGPKHINAHSITKSHLLSPPNK